MGDTEFTAEDNGLHIIIPVKREDMREFEHRSRMIYRQFAVLPNFSRSRRLRHREARRDHEGAGLSSLWL
jgi:hypothetical protein